LFYIENVAVYGIIIFMLLLYRIASPPEPATFELADQCLPTDHFSTRSKSLFEAL
jgi:hypothetical protein